MELGAARLFKPFKLKGKLKRKKPLSKKWGLVFAAVFCVAGAYTLYVYTFAAGQPEFASGVSGMCLENKGGKTVNGNPVTIGGCNGWARQQFEMVGQEVKDKGLCMQMRAGGTTNGTKVEMSACNGWARQNWSYSNGRLVGVKSGKCLTATSAGAQLTIQTCNGSGTQKWTATTWQPTIVPTPSPTPPPAGGNPTPTPATTPTPQPVSGGKNCASNPSACGYPDASNTGVNGSLTSVTSGGPTGNTGSGWSASGGTISVGSGGVLQNVTTSDDIDVTGSNVTIRNVRVHNNNSTGWFGVALRHTSNVTVDHMEISGGGTGNGRMLAGIKDIYGDSSGTKITANNIFYVSTGVQIDEGLIQDNYIHDMGFMSGDHINGTTSNGGTTQLTIQHNTVFNQFSQTDAISLFEDFGVQGNRTINNNLVAGGGYCIYGGQNSGGQAAFNIKITNNRFSRKFYSQCGGQGGGIIAAWPLGGSGGVFSGNIWDDTLAPIN